jgi:hypothetical protein
LTTAALSKRLDVPGGLHPATGGNTTKSELAAAAAHLSETENHLKDFGNLGNADLARIRQMDWVSRTEGRGNAGETADSFFHPSGPSEFGYLIHRKSLILQPKLT